MQASDDMRQGRKSSLIILTSMLIVALAISLMLSVALESYLVVSAPLTKASAIVVMARKGVTRKGGTNQKDRGQEKVLLRARKSGFLASGKNPR